MNINKNALDFTVAGAIPPDSTELIKQITSEIESDIKTLEHALEHGSMTKAGWRLLAAFYLGTKRVSDFNSLTQQYEDNFDAPIFAELQQDQSSRKTFRIVFEIPQKIIHNSLPDITAVCKACVTPTGALIDFSSVRGADKSGLKTLTQFLSQLPHDHTRPETPGLSRFISKLEKMADSKEGTEEIWSLLFEYQRFCNDTHTFDELSIKYAIRFGISPPVW
ncbi:MAG: hypothetical protein NMNS01_22410 [Nitrosomonas sp.]|jgi:hypothetical protein|nr:MAG: hypothetical protein NMNS01_22410 [Nitrosomonas sp.]